MNEAERKKFIADLDYIDRYAQAIQWDLRKGVRPKQAHADRLHDLAVTIYRRFGSGAQVEP